MRSRHVRRLVVGLISVGSLSVLFFAAPPVSAEIGDGQGNVLVTGGSGPNGPEIVISGGSGGATAVGPGLPSWMLGCTWTVMSYFEYNLYAWQRFPIGDQPIKADYIALGWDPDQPWSVVFCNTTDPNVIAYNPGIVFTGILEAWEISSAPPQIVLDWIVARSAASVSLPVSIGTSSPAGDVAAPLITNFATWLWIDPSDWQPHSATAAPVFGTSATVTATPYEVIFASDGEVMSCGNNAGSIYNFAIDDDAQSTSCAMTWSNSSDVGSYTLNVTIRWRVTWACNQFCGTGSLPDFVITSSRPVRVAELQAVGLAPGG